MDEYEGKGKLYNRHLVLISFFTSVQLDILAALYYCLLDIFEKRNEKCERWSASREHKPQPFTLAATYRYATPHRSFAQAPSHALIAASDPYSRRGHHS